MPVGQRRPLARAGRGLYGGPPVVHDARRQRELQARQRQRVPVIHQLEARRSEKVNRNGRIFDDASRWYATEHAAAR